MEACSQFWRQAGLLGSRKKRVAGMKDSENALVRPKDKPPLCDAISLAKGLGPAPIKLEVRFSRLRIAGADKLRPEK